MGTATAPDGKRQVLRYLLAGGAAAAANYGSRFVFSLWWPFEIAVVAAFCVGLVVGFVLMRHYAFEASAGALGPQALRYLVVNLLALLQTLAVSSLLARWLLPALGITSHAEALAHAAGVAVPVFVSYFAHRHGTFR